MLKAAFSIRKGTVSKSPNKLPAISLFLSKEFLTHLPELLFRQQLFLLLYRRVEIDRFERFRFA